ncbi:DMT family transporter [Acetonema longum]|uniref:EamA domain-containing protein n=1 Tax=Acetonema longum DSM 6540 TaxID=1009370 RepID=F7NP34_9FIRM|nr:DMT family transporter [Acetonema longum]EGO62157.1 hypothetical protein ALO_19377 [Acetonema longum DSM 6540]
MKKTAGNYDAFMLLIMVAVLWGVNSVSIKYLTQFFPPLALAPIRLCLASAFLLSWFFYQYGRPQIPRKAWLPIAGVAVFCIFLHQIALTVGIKATSATHAVIILGSNPIFTAVLANFFLKEPFTAAKGLGILLGFGGLMLIVSGNGAGEANAAGDWIMFLATISFVIGSFFVKKAIESVSPLIITAYSHAMAAAGLLLLGLASNPVWHYPGSFEFRSIAVLLFSSFVSTAVGALLWNTAIQKVGASTASLFQNASPIVGIIASAFFLGEQLNWQHFTALTLVLLGVSVGSGVLPIPVWSKRSSRG